MYFGEKLKRLRQEKNWTQPDLAERLGIEQSWLSKIENDKSLPSSELLDKIAESFDLTLQQLLEDLDPNYVSNSLASLPEVRGILQQKKFSTVHNAKKWLLAATVSMAFGFSLLLSGAAELFFKDVLYLYESEGLVFESEPDNLFTDRDNLIATWIDARVDVEDVHAERARKLMELSGRENYQQITSREFLGTFFKETETTTTGAVDIFGSPVPAGSTAIRVYYQSATPQMRHPANSVMITLGFMLLLSSFGLYFSEFRISRLRT